LLPQAQENGVSTTLKIYSPPLHRTTLRNPGSQARVTSHKSRVVRHGIPDEL
jgi:hypothetical protein